MCQLPGRHGYVIPRGMDSSRAGAIQTEFLIECPGQFKVRSGEATKSTVVAAAKDVVGEGAQYSPGASILSADL